MSGAHSVGTRRKENAGLVDETSRRLVHSQN